jgi:predicted O-methyltransferase YrrM
VSRPATQSAALRYVGDLAAADATLLADLAAGAGRILEYGVGASTQIFAQAAAADAEIVGLDRDPYWLERTRALLAELAPGRAVRLIRFDHLAVLDGFAEESFDLVFDDGEDDLRLEFALAAWRLLPVGGRLVFHDTRRPRDAGNVLAVVFRFFREIERIDFNAGDSNLSILCKSAPRPRPKRGRR